MGDDEWEENGSVRERWQGRGYCYILQCPSSSQLHPEGEGKETDSEKETQHPNTPQYFGQTDCETTTPPSRPPPPLLTVTMKVNISTSGPRLPPLHCWQINGDGMGWE